MGNHDTLVQNIGSYLKTYLKDLDLVSLGSM